MGKLYDVAQRHMDEYGVRAAALARRMGTSPQTLDGWKHRGLRRLPEKWLLVALARETRTPYVDVLDAALHDIAYLPEESDGVGIAPAKTEGPDGPAPNVTHLDERRPGSQRRAARRISDKPKPDEP